MIIFVRAYGEAILGTLKYFQCIFTLIFSQMSLDEGFQKNLAASEPNEETDQKLRPQIRETDETRRKRKKEGLYLRTVLVQF